jgi:hypothetical protein
MMKKNLIFSKIAAVLTLVIGALAIVAGGQVLLGKIPDYYLIDWLPVYNFSVGLITLVFTAIIIWKNSQWAVSAAIATLSLHSIVMVILQTAYRDVVAPDSLRAMTVRIAAWLVILVLILTQRRRNIGFGVKGT